VFLLIDDLSQAILRLFRRKSKVVATVAGRV